MLKIDVLADMQRLYPHPVLPVTSVTESVRQTLGFAAIFEATLIGLLLAQRPRHSRRTTSRQGKGQVLIISALPSLLKGTLPYRYSITALKIILYNNIICFCLKSPEMYLNQT